jgi:C-terminal processing protease CtpA/Prc
MFSGSAWAAERAGYARAYKSDWIPTELPDVLAARELRVSGAGRIGYLRVWSFDVDDDEAFVEEVARLLDLLPKNRLIVDLRSNPGGLIWAAERMLQLFTSRRITPIRFSLVATAVTREMAASPFNQMELGAWSPSLDMALLTGDAYAQPLPLTDPSWFEGIPQHYPDGKVVCVVDANTYSSGDIFAAGFVDHKIGPLVSVGEATGAGGANVWTDVDLRQALEATQYKLLPLPDGVRYTVAIRRAIRNGDADGVPIEDLGVPGIPYAFTRDDLLYDNRDLIAFCARQIPD